MNGIYTLRWKMESHTKFTATKDGFNIIVQVGGLGWFWSIVKDQAELDCAYYHSPTHNELSAKVQAEKALNKFLQP